MRILRGTVLIAASLAVTAVAPARSAEHVIQIEVLIEGNHLSILSMRDASSWTTEMLPREPQLNIDSRQTLDHDQSELLAVLYDEGGRVLRTYAYPGRYVSFVESVSNDAGSQGWEGGFGTPRQIVRMLFMEVPPDAMYVLFFRTEVRFDRKDDNLDSRNRDRFQVFAKVERIDAGVFATFGWTFLGKGPLPTATRDRQPSLPERMELPSVFGFAPDIEAPLSLQEWMRPDPTWLRQDPSGQRNGPMSQCVTAGKVTGKKPLHSAKHDGRSYNIVIFGDGFKSKADLKKYQELAGWFKVAIQTTAPFSENWDNINIWRIDTESLTSGIANCPGDSCKYCPAVLQVPTSYYKITGCKPAERGAPDCVPANPPHLGHTDLCPFEVAANQKLPGVHVDLRFVIANCECSGGGAYPEAQLVVVSTCENRESQQESCFKDLALHECAHVVGSLCDEYWVCAKWEGDKYPNLATLPQVQHDDVPWKDLDHSWKSMKHVFKTPACNQNGSDHNSNERDGDGTPLMVSPMTHGAFWGCQFADSSAVDSSSCCSMNIFVDTLGKGFFRPSPICKMRKLTHPFCFVCSDALTKRLRNPEAVHHQ